MTPDSENMDAVIAAPIHHRVLFENEFVRVLETHVEPGDTVPMHTHQWPAVTYFQTWSDLIRRGEHGEVLMDTKEAGVCNPPGSAVWTQPLGLHTLENVGTVRLEVVTVEIKPR
ncbi:MAG TPA: hypothetical protein VK171_15730 [Fimbriimonas sp.]|nr:hypothetical protein [Fimbriimonas sp.]